MINPHRAPSAALIRRPVNSSSVAIARGKRRGNRSTPPESASKPKVTSGRANSAVSAATIKSAASANSKPPPIANPLIAAMTGFPRSKYSVKPAKPPGPWSASIASPFVAAWRSQPAEKKRPVPVMIATLRLASSCNRLNAEYSILLVATSMALALGRSRVMTNMPSEACTFTSSHTDHPSSSTRTTASTAIAP